jgi:intracellular sulfur oxidation DsrE/DsrF family protein
MNKKLFFVVFSAVLLCLGCYETSKAEEPRRIFTHISSDASHRLQKALGYTANQMDRGVLVAVWADDRAVLALSKKNAEAFAKEQALIARLIKGNTTVVACPFSMKNYGVSAEDLLPGVVLGGSFDLVDSLLFAPGVRVLNW